MRGEPFAILFAIALAACSDPAPTARAQPASLAKSVRPGPAATAAVPTVVAHLLETALADAGAQALRQGRAGRPTAALDVELAGRDRFGAAIVLPGFTLRWTPADLARVDWRGIDRYQLLELATLEIRGREGIRAVSYWCNAGDALGGDLTPLLCRDELPRAGGAFMSGAVASVQ